MARKAQKTPKVQKADSYEQEMKRAFTVIEHNITRLRSARQEIERKQELQSWSSTSSHEDFVTAASQTPTPRPALTRCHSAGAETSGVSTRTLGRKKSVTFCDQVSSSESSQHSTFVKQKTIHEHSVADGSGSTKRTDKKAGNKYRAKKTYSSPTWTERELSVFGYSSPLNYSELWSEHTESVATDEVGTT